MVNVQLGLDEKEDEITVTEYNTFLRKLNATADHLRCEELTMPSLLSRQ